MEEKNPSSSKTERTLRTFLCHSSNDKPSVRMLYSRLLTDGVDAWLDEKELLPGQDWDLEIRRAVRASHVIIVCLSRGSINKEGYVQKEIKLALDLADEKPEGTIFIIPLKLEECDVPERLRTWHWVNYFEENGYERLMRALHYRATTVGLGQIIVKTQQLPVVLAPTNKLSSSSDVVRPSQSAVSLQPRSKRATHSIAPSFQLGRGTVMRPFQKSLCPYCFNRIYLGNCEVVSSFNPTMILTPTPRGFESILYRLWVPNLVGARYATEHACRKCYVCGNLLPHNMEYVDNQTIALVGGEASGKSTYIASLIQQFEKDRVRESLGCEQFTPLTDETQYRYEQEYYQPLFINKSVLPDTKQTPPGEYARPLIFVMSFRSKVRNQVRRVNLILFDGAGEDSESQMPLAQTARYITSASALIFFIDPLALPSFVQQLPAHLRNPSTGMDPARIIHKVIEQCTRERGAITETQQIDIPVAFTFGKSDLFKYVTDPKSPPTILRDPTYVDGFKLGDFQAINDEVQAFIKRFDESALLEASKAFKKAAFFAVSSTGFPDQGGKYPNIRPRRCVDPLLWILWQLGYIEAM